MRISLAHARRLALQAQGLDGGWQPAPGKEGAAQVVERLGYVQIDTISVVQRAHHHTLWSRHAGYRPDQLDELLAVDRRVFEYWAHAAAYLPMAHYRYALPRMRARAQRPPELTWMRANAQVIQEVLDRIRAEGPLGSAAFQPPPDFARGSWWQWTPAKRALEYLFDAGVLMVSARRGFQRLYDLAERVLPPGTDTSEPTPDEARRFASRQVLRAHGLASSAAGDVLRGQVAPAAFQQSMAELVESGEALPVEVEGLDGRTYFALAARLEQAARLGQAAPVPQPQAHILSPFDNAVIWRARLRRLFGFDYTLECYVPAGKRKYGYFSLPILWGEQFVGRLDAKAERKAKTLVLRRLDMEPDVAGDDALWAALAARLREFAAFNGCADVVAPDPAALPAGLLAAQAQT